MELEMRLAHLKGEIISINEITNNDLNLNEFRVLGLDFFLEEDMTPEEAVFFRGKDDINRNIPFITRTHFRNRDGDFCMPVFHIIRESDEKESDYSIRFGILDSYDTQHDMYLYNGYFLDLPFGKYKKQNGGAQYKFEYSHAIEDLSLGINQVGTTNIYVYKNNKLVSKHQLIVLPSTMSYQDVEAMIKELTSISRELIAIPYEKQIKHKLYMGNKKADFSKLDNFNIYLQYLNMRLDNLMYIFNKICQNPHEDLETVSQKYPLNKIPKITSKLISQYIRNPARRTYKTNTKRKSFNIYEHRLIKYRLYQLRKYLDNQNVYNQGLRKEQYDIAEKNMNDLISVGKIGNSYLHGPELLNKLQENKNKIEGEIEAQKSNIISYMMSVSKHTDPDIPMMHSKINIVQSEPPEIRRYKNKMSFVFKPKWFSRNETSSMHTGWYSAGHYISEIEIELNHPDETYGILKILLYSFLDNQEKKNINIEFDGVVNWDILKKSSRYTSKKLTIYRIYNLIVNGVPKRTNISDKKIYDFFYKLYIDFFRGESKTYEVNTFYLEAIKEYEKQYLTNKDGIGITAKKLLKSIYDKIDKVLYSPIMINVPLREEKEHLTQIFTNDYNYHMTYKILKEMNTFLEFSFVGDKDKIILKKLDRIYEYWVLTKMLQKLVLSYHWIPDSQDNFRKFLHLFFYDVSQNEKNNKIDHTGYPVVYLHRKSHSCNGKSEDNMHLTLYYDSQVLESIFQSKVIPFSTADKEIRKSLRLSPDFLFRISKGNLEKIFIVDAKCKNYDEMGNNSWVKGDLLGVAAYKYVYRLHKYLKKDVSAAFIVHPDISQYAGNPNRYLGKYVTYDAYGDKRFSRKLEGDDFFRYPLKELELDDNDKQRCSLIGSYYLRPYTAQTNNSSLNLALYFKEIFEYFMEDWEECWNCGSHSIKMEIHYTRSGYKKYYYYCNDCHAFWVKTHCDTCHKTIMKHYKNYFIETNHNAWHVQCPHCSPFSHIKDESYKDNLEPYYPF